MINSNKEVQTEEFKVRSEIYNFLAMVFTKAPELDVLELMKEKLFLKELLSYFSNGQEKEKFISNFKNSIKLLKPKLEKNYLSELSEEFHLLFKVPNIHYLVPYESNYHPKQTHPLGTQITSEINDLYNECGFVLDEKNTEIPDYIGNELAFAGMLMYKLSSIDLEEKKQLNYRKILQKFLLNHLFVWIPNFCQELEKRARSSYYKTWAVFLNQFCRKEKELMSQNIN